LKTGVRFEPGIGSMLDERSAEVSSATLPEPALADTGDFRRRILGVFDVSTGDPVAEVDVIDVATGTKAKTTVTGTVSLAYLGEGAGKVLLRRTGYADQEVAVEIAPGKTIPLTVVLIPKT
jgi:hypothetical protein